MGILEFMSFTKQFNSEYEQGHKDGLRGKEFDGVSFAYHLGWKDGQQEMADSLELLKIATENYFRGGTSI